jgi:hypothetical protein
MTRIVVAIGLFILTACGSSSLPDHPVTTAEKNQAMLKNARELIHTGDIVLRCGRDMTSYKIREMSETDKTYSHAGIALVNTQGIFVYHLTPPELDEPKTDTILRLEPLEKFANPENNFEFGIGRFPFTTDQSNAIIAHLDSMRNSGVSFDFLFDLRTKHKMYCSEMIDDCLRFATHDSLYLKRNEFKDPRLVKRVGGYLKADTNVVRSRLYIPIENIYLHPDCKIIAQYKFILGN